MRYLYLLLSLFVIAPGLYAQGQTGEEGKSPLQSQPRGTNMISCSEYETIKYNGYTIAQIGATDGEASQLQQLWGNYTSVETVEIVAIATYHYNDNRISFRESELTGLTIKESNWPITVVSKNINVGDTFSELQQKFGSDLKVIYKPDIDSNYAVSFGCSGNDGDGLLVYFDPEINKVIEIAYFVNP